jgi:hypothetical protein
VGVNRDELGPGKVELALLSYLVYGQMHLQDRLEDLAMEWAVRLLPQDMTPTGLIGLPDGGHLHPTQSVAGLVGHPIFVGNEDEEPIGILDNAMARQPGIFPALVSECLDQPHLGHPILLRLR